ncbi:MAG: hypothetical protein IJ802_06145 [Kiritimatiellae bacterium]|nr:hypothetical protein [Kiritimatiellia bacterium]
MILTDEEAVSVLRYEEECRHKAAVNGGNGSGSVAGYLNAAMEAVLRNIREVERSEAFYRRESGTTPQLPVSHSLGVAARSNPLLNLCMMAMLFVKSPQFMFERNEFRNTLDMAYLYIAMLGRLVPSSARVEQLKQGFVAFKDAIFREDAIRDTSDKPILRLLAAVDGVMAATLSVAEEFNRLEGEIRKVEETKAFLEGCRLKTEIGKESFASMRRLAREIANETVRTLKDAEPRTKKVASATREKQIDAVKEELKKRVKRGIDIGERGGLRQVCRKIFMTWPGRDDDGYDGYPTVDALYNYCHQHHIVDNLGIYAN